MYNQENVPKVLKVKTVNSEKSTQFKFKKSSVIGARVMKLEPLK